MNRKYCFMNAQRPCDLTCKAAFEVDDPVDNIDCYFIWLAYHFGEGFYEIRKSLEGGGGIPGAGGGAGPGGFGGMPGSGPMPPPMHPKGPKGYN
ncbi:MAG: hypothetical protein ABI054_02355 [Planctomycetota bacterium]|nr:hypothetical protein [Planctomycetota bacterium]